MRQTNLYIFEYWYGDGFHTIPIIADDQYEATYIRGLGNFNKEQLENGATPTDAMIAEAFEEIEHVFTILTDEPNGWVSNY